MLKTLHTEMKTTDIQCLHYQVGKKKLNDTGNFAYINEGEYLELEGEEVFLIFTVNRLK